MALYHTAILDSLKHAERIDAERAASNIEYAQDDAARRLERHENFMGHLAGLLMAPPSPDRATGERLFAFLDFSLDAATDAYPQSGRF